MQCLDTSLPGVRIIEPRVFSDSRGFFFESYHEARFAELGITGRFVQDNHSRSVRGTLRGLHYQVRHPQGKLCRVVQGEVLDVAVDIRQDSPHFGEWVSVLLSAENKRQIYVPEGFAHGFVVLSETAEFLYKCTEFYHPEDEAGIAWNDPRVGIEWGIDSPILSDKDSRNPTLERVPRDLLPRMTPANP
ncbi:MAG TPA: dTDP-4-dehydrorhamnose 3,5-epimerase [Armatimonadota bacterium]|nr:dTDP-4-dehydrorhamnose 3,5-epimerase [Armatimonadota bacterium]